MAPKRAAKRPAPTPPPTSSPKPSTLVPAMAQKRTAKRPAPPPVAASSQSSEETDSRSRSEEPGEDEVATAVTPTPASKNPPQPPQKAEEEEEGSEEESDDEESDEEPTRPAPASKNPPAPPQKGEESESSGEEDDDDEEDDDEEEEEVKPTQAPPAAAAKNPPPPPQESEESSSSEDEEEEGEDEEAPPPPPPPPKPAPKQEANGKDLKPPSSVEAKKPGARFRRIFSTEDEIRMLEALVAHKRAHGAVPQADALIAAVDGKLENREYSPQQLNGKVTTMRRKYEALAKKGELPSKEHDRRVFDLSAILWGGEKKANDTTAAPPTAAKEMANGRTPREFDEMCKLYPFLGDEVKELEAANPGLFKRSFGKMDEGKAAAMDLKIKKQKVVQMRARLRGDDLTKEVTKMLIDLVENS